MYGVDPVKWIMSRCCRYHVCCRVVALGGFSDGWRKLAVLMAWRLEVGGRARERYHIVSTSKPLVSTRASQPICISLYDLSSFLSRTQAIMSNSARG